MVSGGEAGSKDHRSHHQKLVSQREIGTDLTTTRQVNQTELSLAGAAAGVLQSSSHHVIISVVSQV